MNMLSVATAQPAPRDRVDHRPGGASGSTAHPLNITTSWTILRFTFGLVPIVAGIDNGDQVMLQFPGLTEKSGFFGRDQAAYLLDEVFQKAHSVRYQQGNTRKVSAEKQYNITATWTYRIGDKTEDRELFITLRSKDNVSWSLASIRASR